MRVIYIAHPLSAPTRLGIEMNRRNAAEWAAWAAIEKGVSPSCSWVVLTGVLEETEENRARGLACDIEQVKRCDEFWMVGGRISGGMHLEREAAEAAGIPVVDLTHLGVLVPTRYIDVHAPRGTYRDDEPTLPDNEVPTLPPDAREDA